MSHFLAIGEVSDEGSSTGVRECGRGSRRSGEGACQRGCRGPKERRERSDQSERNSATTALSVSWSGLLGVVVAVVPVLSGGGLVESARTVRNPVCRGAIDVRSDCGSPDCKFGPRTSVGQVGALPAARVSVGSGATRAKEAPQATRSLASGEAGGEAAPDDLAPVLGVQVRIVRAVSGIQNAESHWKRVSFSTENPPEALASGDGHRPVSEYKRYAWSGDASMPTTATNQGVARRHWHSGPLIPSQVSFASRRQRVLKAVCEGFNPPDVPTRHQPLSAVWRCLVGIELFWLPPPPPIQRIGSEAGCTPRLHR